MAWSEVMHSAKAPQCPTQSAQPEIMPWAVFCDRIAQRQAGQVPAAIALSQPWLQAVLPDIRVWQCAEVTECHANYCVPGGADTCACAESLLHADQLQDLDEDGVWEFRYCGAEDGLQNTR
jgi:hypothetical protein